MSRHSIEASPSYHTDHTLFLSTNGNGVYRSTDRGWSWEKVNHGLDQLRIGRLAISPRYAADQTILAAGISGGLYKSHNRGEVWHQIHDQDVVITAIHFFSHPEMSEIVMGDNRGRLYHSADLGETWRLYAEVKNSGGITAITSSPRLAAKREVLCGTEKSGIVKITADGSTQVDASRGIPDKSVTSFALSPAYASDATIFATTWFDGVYRTVDDGQTWQKLSDGLKTDPQALAMNLPHFTLVRPSPNFASDHTLFVAGFDGLFQSSDAAQTWSSLEAGTLGRIEGIALSPLYDTDGTIAFSTYRLGAFLSSDRGRTWRSVSQGLGSRLSDVAFSSQYASDHTIFATSTYSFYKSTANGTSWEPIELPSRDWQSFMEGVQRRLFKTSARPSPAVTGDVHLAGVRDAHGLFDALRKGWQGAERQLTMLWYFMTKPWTPHAQEILLSPAFATDQTMYISTGTNRIFRSRDGGHKWSTIWKGRKRQQVVMVISPDFATDRTLFLSTATNGVYKSLDGGDTWQAVRRASKRPYRLGIAISPNYTNDQTVLISNVEGLIKTTDSGKSWEIMDYPYRHEQSPIEAIAMPPTYADDGRILISVRGKGLYQYDREQPTFTPTGRGLIDNNYVLDTIVFSPAFARDNTLYGASQEALLRSTDGARTWQLVATPLYPPTPKALSHQEATPVNQP
ncbi:MAG: hypothetical protein ETSY2_45525 [Candidatus Entotheonella gemina]|uniref:Sortilin N-terminal domain-containing protein n=1 Tax=Candidatus Entotheonella gemina TaxID=1429439 RepID=W4LFR1_9BACT|nr:MAG: hypothetical protein ETSY2_45525 [Candidatus Entotheonella gemina]